jgi:uncharacterized paraquat-inducible protein A
MDDTEFNLTQFINDNLFAGTTAQYAVCSECNTIIYIPNTGINLSEHCPNCGNNDIDCIFDIDRWPENDFNLTICVDSKEDKSPIKIEIIEV